MEYSREIKAKSPILVGRKKLNSKSLIALTATWAEDLAFSQWRGENVFKKGFIYPFI